MTIVPYQGLGVKAYYYSFTESGITIQGLSGFEGTKDYGASTSSKLTSKSQLASLVRLAETLQLLRVKRKRPRRWSPRHRY